MPVSLVESLLKRNKYYVDHQEKEYDTTIDHYCGPGVPYRGYNSLHVIGNTLYINVDY